MNDVVLNKRFVDYIQNKDRFLILYGGRGSSKSDFAAKKVLIDCITQKYYKCVVVRKNLNSIKDSAFANLIKNIDDLGLKPYFMINHTSMKITCLLNENQILSRGTDEVIKIKSLKDPTSIWYEEDIPDEYDFNTLSMTLRSVKADYLQEIFTVNTDVKEKNYKDNWFYKRFFAANENEKNFRREDKIRVTWNFGNKIKYISIFITAMHSTHHDNVFLTDEYRAFLESFKEKDIYYYQVHVMGEWGNKTVGNLLYKKFDSNRDLYNLKYNPDLPLHISFDFNVKPYSALLISQTYKDKDNNKILECIDSIALKYPDNNISYVCDEFIKRYKDHKSGLFIYGDPSGKNQDSKSESGHNHYTIIYKKLINFNPVLRVAKKHPSQIQRISFINSIFDKTISNIIIKIDKENVNELITDFSFQKEDYDGTKMKEKETKNGETYEKFGHFSDSFDYLITELFYEEYRKFIFGDKKFEGITVSKINKSVNKYGY